MNNCGCRLCRRLIIAPTVLTDILVLINVGYRSFQVWRYIKTAYRCPEPGQGRSGLYVATPALRALPLGKHGRLTRCRIVILPVSSSHRLAVSSTGRASAVRPSDLGEGQIRCRFAPIIFQHTPTVGAIINRPPKDMRSIMKI